MEYSIPHIIIPLIIPHLPTPEEASDHLNSQREVFPGLPVSEIRDYYDKNDDVAGVMALDLSMEVLHSKCSLSSLNPSALVERVPKNLPKGTLNWANYANILTLYALISLYQLQQTQYQSQQTPRLLQTLQAIDIVGEAVSDYASWQKSQKAAAAAAKRAKKRGETTPPPPPKKHVSAEEVLQKMPQNTYLDYGRKLIDNRLRRREIWNLDAYSETKNEHFARRLETTSRIVGDVLKRLKSYIEDKQSMIV